MKSVESSDKKNPRQSCCQSSRLISGGYLLDMSKVVMQRTLDVIFTIANFKSTRGERKREGNERTRYAKIV